MARDWIDEHLLGMPGCEKDWKAEWEWWRYQVGGGALRRYHDAGAVL